MPGVAREKRFPERAWRGATATDIAELRAWMSARHSRRHSDELEQWIGAIAEWHPPPALSHHKLRWFRSVLLRYGPPGRRWEQVEAPESSYRKLVRAIRSARMKRQNEKKRSPAPPRASYSHPGTGTELDAPGSSSRSSEQRSRSRSSSGSRARSNGRSAHAPRPEVQPPPAPPLAKLPAPPHW